MVNTVEPQYNPKPSKLTTFMDLTKWWTSCSLVSAVICAFYGKGVFLISVTLLLLLKLHNNNITSNLTCFCYLNDLSYPNSYT